MDNSKYDHLKAEDNIYNYWEKNDLFKPKHNTKKYTASVIDNVGVEGLKSVLTG